jgi:DNA modification methylase
MTLFVNDADFRLYVGDVREQLALLPDESVHCVVTSPPYWGLRDYGTGLWDGGDADCDHKMPATGGNPAQGPNKGNNNFEAMPFKNTCGKCGATRIDQQLGLEPTPDQYVANMVDVFREVRRVLRRDGTCWVNLGDSYASQGGPQVEQTKQHTGSGYHGTNRNLPGLKPKDLVGVPWRVAFALQADGWYLRSDIVWSKPNPMPESVTDRPTKAHEYVFLLTRSPRYFFDQEAVREPQTAATLARYEYGFNKVGKGIQENGASHTKGQGADGGMLSPNAAGRNIRSVWEIPTQPYPEAHFATFPEALPERCIRAGTSERGCCPVCGAPWEESAEGEWHTVPLAPVPCTVLDPFMGSGTVALVARRLGRRSIGVELNPEYARLCARRLQQLSLFAGATDG